MTNSQHVGEDWIPGYCSIEELAHAKKRADTLLEHFDDADIIDGARIIKMLVAALETASLESMQKDEELEKLRWVAYVEAVELRKLVDEIVAGDHSPANLVNRARNLHARFKP